jgi:hypothetical protein
MSLKKKQNNKIDQYILDNPRQPKEAGYFKKVAEVFGVHPEKIRKRWRMLQSKSSPLQSELVVDINGKDTENITLQTEQEVTSLEDVIRISKIDTNVFDVTHYQVKTNLTRVDGELKRLFTIKASVKRKKIDSSLELQKQLLLEEFAKHKPTTTYSPKIASFVPQTNVVKRDCAYEINIPDLHIGKLAWGKENGGEDYDIKIAVECYKEAVKSLLSRVNPLALEKIILPVGNDMINIDNKANTTTGGTPQNCDSRFGKMFQVAKELLISTIDYLSQIAPVEVVVIPGNHDTVAMFTLGEVLDAWYRNNDNVSVQNTHTPRKYLQYGKNLLMYVHGHNEKLQELGIICATEQPQLWAATKFRRAHVGHFHHAKQIKYNDVQEYPGFTVKVLNSLSANDAWHEEKGYKSLKGAEAFLYHREQGLLANYYYLRQ